MKKVAVAFLWVGCLAGTARAESFADPLEDLDVGKTCALVEEHELRSGGFGATIICNDNKEIQVLTSIKLPRYFRTENGGNVSEIDESSVVSTD